MTKYNQVYFPQSNITQSLRTACYILNSDIKNLTLYWINFWETLPVTKLFADISAVMDLYWGVTM